jgi:ankyrin repeat protein
LRKLILFIFFSLDTPLQQAVFDGRLDICRLLVESKADVAVENRRFSPPPSHHLSLTICLAALATLRSKWPSTATKLTLLHTCAALALLNLGSIGSLQ